MSQPIILYDLLRKEPEGQADSNKSWSPNTLKTRYALNNKGLQFTTEWLGFSEIEPKMKELGLAPHPDSYPGPKYTIPTIYDPNTNKIVTDSFVIAKYLDEVYPDTPRLVAPGTEGLQQAYLEKIVTPLMYATIPSLGWSVFEQCGVSEADKEHLRKMRGNFFGRKVEDAEYKEITASMPALSLKAPLDAIAIHVAANGADALFVTGDAPSHVDTAVASVLISAFRILGKEHGLCKEVMGHNWAGRYLKAMSKWE